MNAIQQKNQATVRELLSTRGPCITIALKGNEMGDTAIELKDALRLVRTELAEKEVDAGELLDPIDAAGAEVRGETKARGGIVILRSPSVFQVFRVPGTESMTRVDDNFDLRTLLQAIAAKKQFHILALSQKRTRILKCTQDSAEEIPFPAGYSVSLAESRQTRQPDHTLDNRASGGPSIGGGAVMFGTSTDGDNKDEYLWHFFAEIDKAVNSVLKGSGEPLIAVGVEHEIALYGRVNTYPDLVEPGIHGAPDGLEGGEMHRRALELLEQREQERGREVPADFDRRVGAGLASTHIQDIVAASFQGRVSHLFFQANAHYSGTYDGVRQRVKATEDPIDSPVDLIDAAARQTVLQGGEAKILSGSAMPNGVPVCALFRYSLAQPAAEPEQVESLR
ncbi:MAG: hypothetical protein JO323_13270 [Acidobacteriia bacterium]|nr:hypothetical protein [Terriglobia bacterium]